MASSVSALLEDFIGLNAGSSWSGPQRASNTTVLRGLAT
jgi:hypothetical protein